MNNNFFDFDNLKQGPFNKLKLFWESMAPGVTYDALMQRCSVERDNCCNGDNRLKKFPNVRLLIDLTINRNIELFELTIASWVFQSLNLRDCVILCNEAQQNQVRRYFSDYIPFSCSENFIIEISLTSPTFEDVDSLIVIAHPGDIYHPSFAYSLSLVALQSKAKVITWNSYGYANNKILTKIYRPSLQPLTLLNNNYLDTAFAVTSVEIFKYIRYKNLNNTLELVGLSFKQWLAVSLKNNWVSHSEFLSLQLINTQRNQVISGIASCDCRHSKITGIPLELREENENKFWIPSISPKSITVIIPFKNQVAKTLNCISSVLKQKSEAFIDIILINNQSEPKELKIIKGKLNREIKNKKVVIIDYPYSFNHSRQSNIGASMARGEMIVFLNNDAELIEVDLLDVLARFALIENVATVGCRVVGNGDKLVSAGIVTRSKRLSQTDSPVEENKEKKLSNLIREVTANTFAVVAISKKRFQDIGCLDEKLYPIGYNDVEFCFRALNAGYKHLYIGTRNVFHEPGTSRGKCDESFQKLMLRQIYPWISHQVNNEWKIESVSEIDRSFKAKRKDSIFGILGHFIKRKTTGFI